MKFVPVLYGGFAQYSSKISPLVLFKFISKISTFILFFHEKRQKNDDVPLIKKRYILWKLSLYNMGFLLYFCLKFHILFFLTLSKFSRFGYVPSIKNVTFCEKFRFAQLMPEISPFVQFFDRKQQNKADIHVPLIKNINFSENWGCIISGFSYIFV